MNKVTEEAMWKFLHLVGLQKGNEAAGDESETLDQAVLRARMDMKTVTRAVTSGDYETLALNTPGAEVARAKAIPRYHPHQHQEVPGIVTVIAVPVSKNPDPDFLDKVYQHLDKHRLLTTKLFVTLPLYIEISVQEEVVIKPEYLERTIEQKVKEGLDHFLDHLTGGSQGNGWPFGRPVYVSEIYEVIDGAAGVNYVETGSVRLKKKDGDWQDADLIIPEHGLVCPGIHDITAREE